MMFKWPGVADDDGCEWRVADGFDEVVWRYGWLCKCECADAAATDGAGPAPDTCIHLMHPRDWKDDEPRSCVPAEPWYERNAIRLLREGKTDAVPIVLVMLRKGEVQRTLAVHYGYVMNDDGRTVEKLQSLAG